MAKSGMYLNGKELLECQWEKLNEIERVRCQLETHIMTHADTAKMLAEAFRNVDKKEE